MSLRYPRRYLDERSLKERVFRKIWPTIGKITPDQPDYEAFRIAVSNRILDLISHGITDPDELKAGTMRHFDERLHT